MTPLVLAGLFNWLSGSKKADPDEAVLKQLRSAGSNLTKPHNIEFFLYFPTEVDSQNAANQIKLLGFEIEVRPAAHGPGWLCFAKKTMVPTATDLQEIRRNFNAITAQLKGEYDGWGTGVVH